MPCGNSPTSFKVTVLPCLSSSLRATEGYGEGYGAKHRTTRWRYHGPMNANTLIALTMLFLVACRSNYRTDIRGEDSSTIAAFRVSSPVHTAEDTGVSFGLRLEFDHAGGAFTDTLSLGQTVRLDTVDLSGPGTLLMDFSHTFAGMGAYVSKPFKHFDLEGQAGIALSSLAATASLGGLEESTRFDLPGLYWGGEITYRVSDHIGLFYGLRTFLRLSGEDLSTHQQDLGLRWIWNSAWVFSGGYRYWNYLSNSPGESPSSSDLDLTLEGPFVRLEFIH